MQIVRKTDTDDIDLFFIQKVFVIGVCLGTVDLSRDRCTFFDDIANGRDFRFFIVPVFDQMTVLGNAATTDDCCF